MPQEIRLSQLQDRAAFEQAVAEHVNRLTAFNKETGTARPVAHPLVEAAVKRIAHPKASKKPDEYVADYVIVDDTPPPPPPLSLFDRKQVLLNKLRVAENEAKEKVLPHMKRRLIVLQFQAAATKSEEDRSDADKALIADYKAKHDAMTAIELAAAQAEAALADVTEDTVDNWQLPNFG